MFALFFNLYYSMFFGTWLPLNIGQIRQALLDVFNSLGTFLTSIFGDNQMTTLGDVLMDVHNFGSFTTTNWISLVAFVLALITSIGIVVMAVKGVKRAFGIFFMGIRR